MFKVIAKEVEVEEEIEINPAALEEAQKYFNNNIDAIVSQIINGVGLTETPALKAQILTDTQEAIEAFFSEYLRYTENPKEVQKDMTWVKSEIVKLVQSEIEENKDKYFKLTK